jgi:PAS domain S-box-containing protein
MTMQADPIRLTEELDAGDRALKESIRQYRRMVQTVEDGVMVLDADNTIVFINQELADMLGYPVAALVGTPLSAFLIDNEGVDGVRARRPRVSVSEESEIRLRAGDGSVKCVLVRSIPLFDGNGQFCGIRSRVSDMTALKQAETEVVKLREQLASRSALLEQGVQERSHMEEFVATVSHEFRTPLTSVRGYIDLMLSDPDLPKDQQDKYLHRLMANADHLASLLNSILDLSRIADGHVQLSLRPVSLLEILDEVQETMAPQFDEKQIRFAIEVGDKSSVGAWLVTDRVCLIRILSNLLSNACKYTPEGGQVTLTAEIEDDTIWFSVSDNGVGIPASEQERIFSKFYRGSNTRRLGSRGTGLGLAITRSLVELLGGEIGFVSHEDMGTVFRMSLPLHPRG